MKSIFKLVLAALLLVGMTAQSSAQCAHTATNIAGFPATQGVGVGFGQSFLADCVNDEFTDITFSLKNFNNAVWTVELFDGQSDDPADLLYSQAGVVPTMGAANPNSGGVFYTATLSGGTGSLAYTQGQTYTFICTLESGSHAVEFGLGDQYAQGAQYYSNTSFTSVDNHFEFGSGASSGAACNISQTTFVNTNAMPTINNHAQSFSGACTESGTFSHLQINRKDFGARTGTLYIYNGESVDPADQVYSQPISLPDATGAPQYYNVEIPIGGGTGDLTYTPGNVYTYRIATVGNIIPTTYNVGSSHPGGSAYWDGAFKSGSDFYFDITIEETVPPVPTMGEWALITFGLIIMSMGVITVRRREQDLIVKAA